MTAVEWYLGKLFEIFGDEVNKFTLKQTLANYDALKEAEELEKKQIINFTNEFIEKHTFGDYDGIVQKNKTIEEYYNETFNK